MLDLQKHELLLQFLKAERVINFVLVSLKYLRMKCCAFQDYIRLGLYLCGVKLHCFIFFGWNPFKFIKKYDISLNYKFGDMHV